MPALFQVDVGFSDGNIYYISGIGIPGGDTGVQDNAPVGSRYTDIPTGLIYRKTVVGSGTDKWDLYEDTNISELTDTIIPFVSSGELTEDVDLTYDNNNQVLNVNNILVTENIELGTLGPFNDNTKVDGTFYSGTSDPTNTTRLNYDGNFYASNFFTGNSPLIGIPAGGNIFEVLTKNSNTDYDANWSLIDFQSLGTITENSVLCNPSNSPNFVTAVNIPPLGVLVTNPDVFLGPITEGISASSNGHVLQRRNDEIIFDFINEENLENPTGYFYARHTQDVTSTQAVTFFPNGNTDIIYSNGIIRDGTSSTFITSDSSYDGLYLATFTVRLDNVTGNVRVRIFQNITSNPIAGIAQDSVEDSDVITITGLVPITTTDSIGGFVGVTSMADFFDVPGGTDEYRSSLTLTRIGNIPP